MNYFSVLVAFAVGAIAYVSPIRKGPEEHDLEVQERKSAAPVMPKSTKQCEHALQVTSLKAEIQALTRQQEEMKTLKHE